MPPGQVVKKPSAKKKKQDSPLPLLVTLGAVAAFGLFKFIRRGGSSKDPDAKSAGKGSRSTFAFDRPKGSNVQPSTSYGSPGGPSSASSSLPRNKASANAKGKEKRGARAGAAAATATASSSGASPGPSEDRCGGCDKLVKGSETVRALEKVWHKNCFKCQVCSKDMTKKNTKIWEHAEKPVCTECFTREISPTCARCGKQCTPGEKTVTAMGVSYHAACFTCSRCRRVLGSTFTIGTRGPMCTTCT